jgi:pepF/M3 family oligoendopeptidase
MEKGGFFSMRWSLDELYPSFDSQEWNQDFNWCLKQLDDMKNWVGSHLTTPNNAVQKITTYLSMLNEFYDRFTRLHSFASLTLSGEAKHEQALQMEEKLEEKATELVLPQVQFQKWVGSLDNKEEIITDTRLEQHRFYLEELVRDTRYMLTDAEETLISKMKNTGSNAWSKLQETVSSTLLVDISVNAENERLPLSVVRNMAYDNDPLVRKTAYEAELNAYPKIEDASAASLNAIKGEVITLSKRRGYTSALDKTLQDARMDHSVLLAMLTAMKESLPAFRRFYRHKAKLLGYDNGLPFYELFAPIGNVKMQFTYEQAEQFIVQQFRTFSDKLSDFAQHAFRHQWIDAEPREGKRGGAFCSNLHSIKESRILANFSGSFSSVTTLAHELGHGYHGSCLEDETYLNSNYPMPLAETASIFCETIIKNAAMKKASPSEVAVILENEISDSGQVIVDIYSRFLFENELFRRREEASLSVKELKELMIDSQKKAYGDGLDANYLHPYMWVCKPHYYYASVNYYNYPYAFGLLFAKGLYAEYLRRGQVFIESYDQLLAVTGKMKVLDAALSVGIDISTVEFWKNSLKLIETDIDRFIAMT